ncbi:MAG: N-acetylmuramoyl-L-alanine amidase [Candidatus Riflebacteria bacterium]|nr:N-acetylmuramoyl-L-alanine amidase [Candidatus Riflebacteria bacterium]
MKNLAIFCLFISSLSILFAADQIVPADDKLPIFSRDSWNATQAVESKMIPQIKITAIVVHHSAGTAPEPDNETKVLKGIQSFHMDDKNWGDTAYHYLIAPSGRIYEGRNSGFQGDSGTKYDLKNKLMICMLGNYQEKDPTAQATKALSELLIAKMKEYELKPENIFGHRDLAVTECPGNKLYQWLKVFLSKLTRSQGYLPLISLRLLEQDSGNCQKVFSLFFLKALSSQRPPEQNWLYSDYWLIRGMRRIVSESKLKIQANSDSLGTFAGDGAFITNPEITATDLVSKDNLAVPLVTIYLYRARIERALEKHLALTSDLSKEVAARLIEQVAKAIGFSMADLGNADERLLSRSLCVPSLEKMNKVTDAIWIATLHDRTFDIPYVAGYSKTNGRNIYIDRSLPIDFADPQGKRIKVDPFLVIHEAIEKAFIDEFGLCYHEAHQMALRIEQAGVEAAGISWKGYDDFFVKQIDLIDRKPVLRVPHDLDLTPYVDESDERLPLMRRLMK